MWVLTSLEHKFDPNDFDLVNNAFMVSSTTDVKALQRAMSAAFEQRREEIVERDIKGGGFKRWFVRWGGLFCGQNAKYNKSRRRVGLFFESLLFYIGSICQQGKFFLYMLGLR